MNNKNCFENIVFIKKNLGERKSYRMISAESDALDTETFIVITKLCIPDKIDYLFFHVNSQYPTIKFLQQ